MDKEIYWIGVRSSEVEFVNGFFKDNISMFGQKKVDNLIQPLNIEILKNFDHNNEKNDAIAVEYQKNNIAKILAKNPNARFMFYNQIIALKYYDGESYVICLNDKNLIEKLDNKIHMREYLKDKVPVLHHYIIPGKDISLDNLNRIFNGNHKYVIQAAKGAGGSGTLVFYSDDQKKLINPENNYLVTIYHPDNISINVHLMISQDKVLILPESIQIIENHNDHLVYKGCDFIGYNEIDSTLREKTIKYAGIIGKQLQQKGYLGVCGIDFLIYDNEVYFIEINSRFQNSSTVLDKSLAENNIISLQEMNYRCFYNIPFNYTPIKVNYSCYILDYGNNCNNLPTINPIQTLDENSEEIAFDELSYWKSYIYDKSIYYLLK